MVHGYGSSGEGGRIKWAIHFALETLAGARQSLSSVDGAVLEKAKVVAEGADDFIHRSPWEAVGVAVGMVLLIGPFIRRR